MAVAAAAHWTRRGSQRAAPVKQDDMDRCERPGDQDEDGPVIEACQHQVSRRLSPRQQVVDAAHGQEEHTGKGINREGSKSAAVTPAAAQQRHRQHRENPRRQGGG